MSQQVRWQRFPDSQAVAEEAVRRILAAARAAVEANGAFRVVLAGGSTPLKAYRLLASEDADWQRWQVYLGDERCLAADDPQRNSAMISRAWLERGGIPARNIHWIAAERGAEFAAHQYERAIQDALPFDLVLLGMGEDGHTASLFPGHDHDSRRLVVPVYRAPKAPPERVSLGYQALSRCAAMLMVVTGSGKAAALQAWRSGSDLPVARLRCASGIDVLLDADAVGEGA
jgi:6-phosphogluconolactonase